MNTSSKNKIPPESFELHLIANNIISQNELNLIKDSIEYERKGLFQVLLSINNIDDNILYSQASQYWGLSVIDLEDDDHKFNRSFGAPWEILQSLSAIPLIDAENNSIVAIGNPENLSLINRLDFYTNDSYRLVLANIHQINKFQNKNNDLITDELAHGSEHSNELDQFLRDAYGYQASDLHIEPYKGYCRLRIRVDGILHPLKSISIDQGRQLIAQIKLICGMDIAQSRLPQDGRFNFSVDEKQLSLRVNSLPTLYGEKLVLRFLQQHHKRLNLTRLGLLKDQYQLINEALQHPNGLILVCGPTGSGKTVTLYSLIKEINTGKENISTIEDPVEINEDGINQVSVNRKSGLDFNLALRTLLRQDPDVIMLGEIRDSETAQTAVKAAQTGHLVMATLHSRNTAMAKNRLLQLGVDSFSFDEAIRLIIAQRLPRVLCQHCRIRTAIPISLKNKLDDIDIGSIDSIYKANGCTNCLQGYQGRTGIFEIKLPELPHETCESANELKPFCDDLERTGIKHILQGTTSYEEILRVL